MSQVSYYIGFNLIPGIGRARTLKLEQNFASMEQAWHADAKQLKAAGLDTKSVEAIISGRSSIALDREMEKLATHNVKAHTWNDPEYPSQLRDIYDAPPVIYVKGMLTANDYWSIAVVGSRQASVYGKEIAEGISKDLARNKITVISGLARGIDTVAHKAALRAGGRTIAVMGCGLDMIYPAENAELAKHIAENGALISDYPIGTKPAAHNFPRRNRIMSGLSLGVLVVEAADASGALITADMALEQNREVFAVPGNVLSPLSRGTNHLIQDGAKLVMQAEDILEELNLSAIPAQVEPKQSIMVSETESALIKQLSYDPTHIDAICRSSGLGIAIVSSNLAMMELRGLVKQVNGMNYVLSRQSNIINA
ncbi:MAG: DNA-protecting protein DprA [Chloroflexi bacterium]|jgi:DNA processing protein|nr:DNA-protecting protein DprA [Chloroflexota bacterium]MBT7080729.1 DNA-protecting protein DprA [Chloroflexota bacterium]MBT7290872.1 DNA-protecting protein DprA [Chloroflexota bacterium]